MRYHDRNDAGRGRDSLFPVLSIFSDTTLCGRPCRSQRLGVEPDEPDIRAAQADFLFSQAVQPWAELPLWIPDAPDTAGFWAVSGASAKAAGLRTRPFADSVRDTWQWLQSGGEVQPAPGTPPFGLASSKQQQVLDAWDARLPGDNRTPGWRPRAL